MHLLQIHEPGQTPEPHADESGIAVGIDLGTTNTVIAWAQNANVELITDDHGRAMIPSVVAYAPNGDVLVGQTAAGKIGDPAYSVISSVKRLMGKSAEQIPQFHGVEYWPVMRQKSGAIALDIFGRPVTAVEISAEILKTSKWRAESALGKKIDRAVITVPAYFDDAARTATRDAARLAGIEVLRLLNEPTAAAVAYGLDQNAQGIYAIYDLGGGTFDVSILKLDNGVFRVLATGGDTQLGGDDIDRAIIDDWTRKFGISVDTQSLAPLKELARNAKESAAMGGNWNGLWQKTALDLNAARLAELAQKMIDRTMAIMARVLFDAQIEKSAVNDVILVGGSTRLPLVRQTLSEYFGKPPLSGIDPDTVVAAGAAIQAEALTRGASHLLLDVLPLSLGIETYGGLVSKIIERNTPIPVAKAQEFTTQIDGQGGMSIHVVQGERETADGNRSLAKFELFGIPPMTAGIPRIRVTFTVDADGLLTVSASEKTTGISQRIEVKPTYGLDESAMADMLRAAMDNAAEDMEKRLLLETRMSAESLISAVMDAVQQDRDMLDQSQYAKLMESAKYLQQSMVGGDRAVIAAATHELEQEFLPFAQLRLDRAIAQNLTGQDVRSVKAS